MRESELGELAKLLAEFHDEYRTVREDEISRFQFLCDSMFSVFTSRDHRRLADGSTVDWLPAAGNLDTGDSGFPPPQEVVETLTDMSTIWRELPRYVGPETEPALEEAVARFLRDEGLALATELDRLGTVVGCGTVNLFDALCRDLVQRPGDVILMPSVGYGFFLAQPYRAGGAVEMVECEQTGRVRPDVLARRIAEVDQELYRRWFPLRHAHVTLGLQDARRRGLVTIPEDDLAALVDRFVDGLPTDAAPGRRELRRRLLTALPRRQPVRQDPRRDLVNLVRPPAVRALLHISPAVTGHVYREYEVAELGAVLRTADIAVVEDLAYHSVRLSGDRLHSLQGRVPTCHTLLGLSKPFGMANIRVGLMLVDRRDVKRLRRLVENSVGFVPLVAQRAAAAALGLHRQRADDYLHRASHDPYLGYENRLTMFRAMLRGTAVQPVPEHVETEIRRYALALLGEKRAAGTEVTGDTDGDRRLVDEFLQEGLSRWFTLAHEPEAGFFGVVDCRPLLARGTLTRAGIEARTAFDVFAFLAYTLGVRTIPEEGMRLPTNRTRLLRMSFSPAPRMLVECLFSVYSGLRFLEG
ncbi:aminotransferase class I/II-fold pyridoxal phosphate-dependent enzyme [Micromonospora sp. NPDC050187]|uniref:aminotransferase class I/II-fold pyridoxal phosphate-dependent enzyme n=1 Tax=Micromonospora sp. NPDC050187 TaxID=3364277 RepID=UPI0037A408C1